MDKPLDILLVGIGGYGNKYVNALLDNKKERNYKIRGVVDPYPQGCQRLAELEKREIQIYSTMDQFYLEEKADLVCISSPIQYHLKHIVTALDNGSNVLCEKPLSATVESGNQIINKKNQSGKFVAIGYQWSFSDAIQELKRDIIKGVLGRAVRLKTIVLWPRSIDYYNRNNWAGKIKDNKGNWVFDSVANNATAHFLHNMYYLLGSQINQSATLKSIQAETYKVNDIETFDTVALRTMVNDGTEVLFYATHAVKERVNPRFVFEFEQGVVTYDGSEEGAEIIAEFEDGSMKNYGDPFKDDTKKIWLAIDAVENKESIYCGPEATLAQVQAIKGIHQSVGEATRFAEKLIRSAYNNNEEIRYVEGLDGVLEDCYDKYLLPTELGISWAKSGKLVKL
ncbi:putative dehydrogenase [Orenia metallireducens]|uniref:Gfo/Idh/MocA family protein n=1 Tax=Orenia metallireducens TaxID=1413210 RepID=UPI000D05E7EA|nr:Gfo/Idh/MocA family oxidoreductase [Orenia metallireducens]PRX24183.1 putative dehydrogenase [Orenia metallireducens]